MAGATSTQGTSAAPRKARRRGLNRLSGLRNVLVQARLLWCRRVWGMDLHPTMQMSLLVKLDTTLLPGMNVRVFPHLI